MNSNAFPHCWCVFAEKGNRLSISNASFCVAALKMKITQLPIELPSVFFAVFLAIERGYREYFVASFLSYNLLSSRLLNPPAKCSQNGKTPPLGISFALRSWNSRILVRCREHRLRRHKAKIFYFSSVLILASPIEEYTQNAFTLKVGEERK